MSVRGLRTPSDFEYELPTVHFNRILSKGAVETHFLATSLEYAHLSSSAVREVAKFKGDIKGLVPDCIINLIYEKYGTSPTGGCLGSLIQLPFLFALWPVVQNVPAYVNGLKEAYNKFNLILLFLALVLFLSFLVFVL